MPASLSSSRPSAYSTFYSSTICGITTIWIFSCWIAAISFKFAYTTAAWSWAAKVTTSSFSTILSGICSNFASSLSLSSSFAGCSYYGAPFIMLLFSTDCSLLFRFCCCYWLSTNWFWLSDWEDSLLMLQRFESCLNPFLDKQSEAETILLF